MLHVTCNVTGYKHLRNMAWMSASHGSASANSALGSCCRVLSRTAVTGFHCRLLLWPTCSDHGSGCWCLQDPDTTPAYNLIKSPFELLESLGESEEETLVSHALARRAFLHYTNCSVASQQHLVAIA